MQIIKVLYEIYTSLPSTLRERFGWVRRYSSITAVVDVATIFEAPPVIRSSRLNIQVFCTVVDMITNQPDSVFSGLLRQVPHAK